MLRLSKVLTAFVVVGGVNTALPANAQELTSYEIGRELRQTPFAAFGRAVVFGENPQLQFPPRVSRRSFAGTSGRGGGTAYCVRTCDGRYFPAPSAELGSRAEVCKSLCPISETKVFYGISIDGASEAGGKRYSALANAFRFRKELVAGCTCNGKDAIGLASINVAEDKTVRGGDMVSTAEGMKVVRSGSGGESKFTSAPRTNALPVVTPFLGSR